MDPVPLVISAGICIQGCNFLFLNSVFVVLFAKITEGFLWDFYVSEDNGL